MKFYEKRLTRVYIPYLCLGIPYFIWLYVIVNPNIVKFLTFVFPVSFWIYGNDQGMWYIDIILIFYLVFPFLYRCIETKNGKIYVITFIILGVALNISLYFLDRAYYELIGIGISKAPLMIYGIYIGKCAYERKTIKYSSMALISAAWFIAYIFVPKEFMGYTWLCDGRSVLGCLYLVLLLSFIKNKCINKILAFFGGLTLELYLLHLYIGSVLSHYNICPKPITQYCAAIILSIVVACAFSNIYRVVLRK